MTAKTVNAVLGIPLSLFGPETCHGTDGKEDRLASVTAPFMAST
jgi:hypothetical protein